MHLMCHVVDRHRRPGNPERSQPTTWAVVNRRVAEARCTIESVSHAEGSCLWLFGGVPCSTHARTPSHHGLARRKAGRRQVVGTRSLLRCESELVVRSRIGAAYTPIGDRQVSGGGVYKQAPRPMR